MDICVTTLKGWILTTLQWFDKFRGLIAKIKSLGGNLPKHEFKGGVVLKTHTLFLYLVPASSPYVLGHHLLI